MRSMILAVAAFLGIGAAILGALPANKGLDQPAFAEDRTNHVPDGAHIKFPDVKEIESMVADVYCHPFEGLVGRDFSGFSIPQRHFGDVLKYFENCEIDKIAPEDRESDEIGTIRINYKSGGNYHNGCVRICWFEAVYLGRLHFSYAGRRYVRTGERFASDDTLTFDFYIRSLYEEAHKEREKAPNIGPAAPTPRGAGCARR